MDATRYLIVGGGMTGDAAAKGIREHDPDGSIRLVGAEPHAPYARPPLSKKLWLGGDEEKIWRHTDEAGVDLRLGRRIVSLDLEARQATDDARRDARVGQAPARDGRVAAHASRRRGRRLLPDARRLPPPPGGRPAEGSRVVVIGGGFIGSELAAVLTANGRQRDDGLPRPGDRLAAPAGGALRASSRSTTASRASRC